MSLDERIDGVEGRVDALRKHVDGRFDTLNVRLDNVGVRLDSIQTNGAALVEEKDGKVVARPARLGADWKTVAWVVTVVVVPVVTAIIAK